MNRLVLICIFTFCIINLSAQQKDTINNWPSNNTIKTNIIGYFSGHTSFTFERVLSPRLSMLITYGNGGGKTIYGEEAKDLYMSKYGGYSVNYQIGDFKYSTSYKDYWSFELRYYLSHGEKRPPKGLHIGPSVDFLKLSDSFSIYDINGTERSKDDSNYKITTLSLNCGFQFMVYQFIALDLVISPGYGFVNGTETYSSDKYKVSGSGFSASFGLFCGLAFGK